MSIEIRRAGPGDEGLFERIADDVFDYAVDRGVLATYLATPGHHFVVALSGGEVVGQVAAVLHRHADLRPVELYIDEVAVAPAFRRQGVAKALLAHIVREAERRQYHRLSLETGSMDAFLPARELYESFGFSYCPPFGDYAPDPNSVFLTKVLA